MAPFDHSSIDFKVLRERAYNFRWADMPEDIIPLTTADSDFPIAPELVRGLTEAVSTGYMPYVPPRGYPEVRQSIARQLNRRKNEHVDPELLLPIDSASTGMHVIARTFLQPGDEAVIFDPVDYIFYSSVTAAGAKAVRFPARLTADNRIDLSGLESSITPRTRMIGLCNPHNPLGTVFPAEDLQLILDLAEKYDLYIINNEVWSDIVYPPKKFTSILSLRPESNRRVLSVYGFSKGFSIAGLRSGCIYAGDGEMFERLVNTSSVMSTAGGVSCLSQTAAKICMDECYGWNAAFVEHLRGNRDYAVERIGKMPGIVTNVPDATFMLFPDITATGLSSDALREYLLREGLAIISGSEYFGPRGEGHIRICLATSREILQEAMDRLERALVKLAQSRNI